MASAKLKSPKGGDKKDKKRKLSEAAALDDVMNGDASVKADKKTPKDKKRKGEDAAANGAAPAAAAVPAAAGGGADTPAAKKAKKEKESKKDSSKKSSKPEAAPAAAVAGCAEAPKKDPASLDNFPQLSDTIRSLLRSKGIEALFPIQTACLDHALNGFDIVGRARTGCGKTLAFVLPIVQSLLTTAGTTKKAFGRKPLVVVLAPTRELAKQVRLVLVFFLSGGVGGARRLWGIDLFAFERSSI